MLALLGSGVRFPSNHLDFSPHFFIFRPSQNLSISVLAGITRESRWARGWSMTLAADGSSGKLVSTSDAHVTGAQATALFDLQ